MVERGASCLRRSLALGAQDLKRRELHAGKRLLVKTTLHSKIVKKTKKHDIVVLRSKERLAMTVDVQQFHNDID